jgi:hypothetical protein
MDRIQIITIILTILFLLYIARLIVRGRLREEYSIAWIICSALLLVFSFWRNGLEIMAKLLGVVEAPNLIFTGAIFAILIYLLHLSVVASRLYKQNKQMAQDIALLKEKLERKLRDKTD